MATFVLVGGAWIGAWAWRDVTNDLRGRGHSVYPLSLTGLGERVHLGSPETGLDTHVTDIVNLIEFEDLSDVILAVHSYAGTLGPLVVDKLPAKIAGVAYVDTFSIPDGQRMFDFNSEEGKKSLRETVASRGEGWKLPAPTPEELARDFPTRGMDDAVMQRWAAHAVAHPFKTWTDVVKIEHAPPASLRNLLVEADDAKNIRAFDPDMLSFTNEPGWTTESIDTGHWPMLSTPTELADILDRFGRG